MAKGNTLYSQGNLSAHTNNRVLSLCWYCSCLSRCQLEPRDPGAGWHCRAMWKPSTTPLENPQHWITVHGCAADAPASCWLQNSCWRMIRELLSCGYCSHCTALATSHHEQGTTANGAGNALGVFLPWLSWGWKFYFFLGAVYLRPKRNLREGAQAPALGHQQEITNGEWDVRELTACCGGAELLKQHMPPSAPLLSACGLYTLQVFVFNSRSFSFTFLGDFLSNAVYVYFLFPSQCPPTPMAVFFLL